MPKPVCLNCQRFYRLKKNGVRIVEGAPLYPDATPGAGQDANWRPYKLWMADLWYCPGCGHELVAGFGHNPIAIEHHDGFAEKCKSFAPLLLQINDC